MKEPLLFQLPGPRANIVTNNRDVRCTLIPQYVLEEAMVVAGERARARNLFACLEHPDMQRSNGQRQYLPDLHNRAALITHCGITEWGETWFTFEVLRTREGKDLRALVEAQALLGVSAVSTMKYFLSLVQEATPTIHLVRSLEIE